MTVFLAFQGLLKCHISVLLQPISQIWENRQPKNAVFSDIKCQTLVQKTQFSNKRVTWVKIGQSKKVMAGNNPQTRIL